ncbi:MAG: hypothetical protein QNK23_02710 [Crocinitomicaceae bacterium]|nr:hypothetical protein [Crocinitomicaceae bacterium]
MSDLLDSEKEPNQSKNGWSNILWILAAVCIVLGSVFKLLHYPFAHIILLTGLVLGMAYILINLKRK